MSHFLKYSLKASKDYLLLNLTLAIIVKYVFQGQGWSFTKEFILNIIIRFENFIENNGNSIEQI